MGWKRGGGLLCPEVDCKILLPMSRSKVRQIFHILMDEFGEQGWWPGRSRLEVIVGAILTQNTAWKNVEKALENLGYAGLLPSSDEEDALEYARRYLKLGREGLARLIKPAGFFNQKAEYLLNFMEFFVGEGGFAGLGRLRTETLRKKLLSVKGIGRETADSILLYAFERPVFVVDAYTLRIFSRHGMDFGNYEDARRLVEDAFSDLDEGERVRVFNEFHALLVRVGKDYCRKRNPLCSACPLNSMD